MIIIFVVHPWAQAAVAVAASQYIISSVCWMDGGWLTEVDLNNHHHQHNNIIQYMLNWTTIWYVDDEERTDVHPSIHRHNHNICRPRGGPGIPFHSIQIWVLSTAWSVCKEETDRDGDRKRHEGVLSSGLWWWFMQMCVPISTLLIIMSKLIFSGTSMDTHTQELGTANTKHDHHQKGMLDWMDGWIDVQGRQKAIR